MKAFLTKPQLFLIKIVTLTLFLFSGSFFQTAMAQQDCTYTIELFDSYGDGWNGNVLVLNANNTPFEFTIEDGFFGSFEITFDTNTLVQVSLIEGAFITEISYNIVDPNGDIIFAVGPFPFAEAGENIFGFSACSDCDVFSVLPIEIIEVNDLSAVVAWNDDQDATNYLIEWGVEGFEPGTGAVLETTQNEIAITGLEENTTYDVYVAISCGADTTAALGPITFTTIYTVDVGIGLILNPNNTSCNLGVDETVTIGIQNFGQRPQSLFEYYFAVNGEVAPIPVPSDGFFTGVLGKDSLLAIDFETTYDFSIPGFYVIEAWTALEGDSDTSNDTFRLEIVTAYPLPLVEDIEDGIFPENWISNGFFPIAAPFDHNNETWVISGNVYEFFPVFEVTTLRLGPLNNNDSLTFDYRMVDFFDGTVATTFSDGDSLVVEVSVDCGATWNTELIINNINHTSTTAMTNRTVDLSAYAGEAITVRFRSHWGEGDYWVDLDNINILSCPVNLGLSADIAHPLEDGTLGTITVNPNFGLPPYQYSWDVLEETQSISDLESGVYTVTVTDALGCMDVAMYDLELMPVSSHDVNLSEIELMVSPNPTQDLANIYVATSQVANIDVQLFSMDGKILNQQEAEQITETTFSVDLSNEPAGIYFVRFLINDRTYYERLMLTK